MESFEKLHPALQHHIVNSLGWPGLRPLQEAAIDPLLAGEHAILLAPTAGGKTEAAIFPVLSRMLTENWNGLSVLYLCPIKALLNNLEPRLEYYSGLLGRRVGLWHGDVKASHKKRIQAEPPDILLTTPESLEVMLVSRNVDHQHLLGNIHTVIVDEVHAFAGDDRGWHMLYLLERLQVVTGHEIQRIGCSATVGNPQGLCDWLAGNCKRPRQVINPPAEQTATPEVTVDWVGSIANAAMIIARLHRGEKRLVFCDSRKRVEELALELRQREVKTFLSHSSISLEERQAAEQAFSEGQDCVIVATSTLELGIDVGDLDRVIQIDAPGSVASFLQRIGRTGRRAGTSRNCLFLCTREHAFLQTLALLQLWHEGFVEPVIGPPEPWHLLAQQVMALTLQEPGLGAHGWQDWLPSTPGLADQSEEQLHAVVEHMVNTQVLHSDQGVIGIGAVGEKTFGHRNFMELFSVFVSAPLIKIMHGRQEIGEVDKSTFAGEADGGATVLTLAGRAWKTRSVDWRRQIAYVEPTDARGSSKWVGSGQALPFHLCQMMQQVLVQDSFPLPISERACAMLDETRDFHDWVESGSTILLKDGEHTAQWWTFAGSRFNTAAAGVLEDVGTRVQANNLSVDFNGISDLDVVHRAILDRVIRAERDLVFPLSEEFVDELKFNECLSDEMKFRELSLRFDVQLEHESVVALPIKLLHIRS